MLCKFVHIRCTHVHDQRNGHSWCNIAFKIIELFLAIDCQQFELAASVDMHTNEEEHFLSIVVGAMYLSLISSVPAWVAMACSWVWPLLVKRSTFPATTSTFWILNLLSPIPNNNNCSSHRIESENSFVLHRFEAWPQS